MQFKIIIIAILLCLAVTGCNKNKAEENGDAVARVYDKYLYVSDIAGLTKEGISKEDSTRIVNDYIDNWIRQNLILKVAEDNLQSALADINKQALDYKESLIIYAYERQWLAENLDTIVADDSLENYFENNLKDFRLKTDIYKLAYAVTPSSNKTADSIQYWFSRGIEKYRYNLERYCAANCKQFSINTSIWLNEDDLFKLLPYDMYAEGKFRTKGPVYFNDGENKYYVKVEDFYIAGTTGPYAYYKSGVKDIIINKRKMELLKNTYQNIYADGLKRNNAEFLKKEE
ncbi:MAG: hypothetical protein ACHQFW_03890 [Chitinophagales bacterium]